MVVERLQYKVNSWVAEGTGFSCHGFLLYVIGGYVLILSKHSARFYLARNPHALW